MFKTRLILVVVMVTAFLSVMAQSAFSNIPQTVDYRDATITDVGVMANDIYQWEVTDKTTGKIDTVYTTQEYILWESDGDIERQAEAIRAEGLNRAIKSAISTEFREGSLKEGWLCNFYYNVFKYDYPSVDSDGNATDDWKKVMRNCIGSGIRMKNVRIYGCALYKDGERLDWTPDLTDRRCITPDISYTGFDEQITTVRSASNDTEYIVDLDLG